MPRKRIMLTYEKVFNALAMAEVKPCPIATGNDVGRGELNLSPEGDLVMVWSVHTDENMEDFEVEVYGTSPERCRHLATWVWEVLQDAYDAPGGDMTLEKAKAVRYGLVMFRTEDRRKKLSVNPDLEPAPRPEDVTQQVTPGEGEPVA